MNEDTYLIVRCAGCDAVWAMDYEPESCTCDYDGWPEGFDEIVPVPGSDFRDALAKFKADAYPKVTTDGG